MHPRMKGLLLLEEAYPTKYWLGSLPLLGASPIDFTFATLHGRRELHEAAERAGMKTMWLGCRSSLDYPSAISRLTKLIRTEKFDILHLNESIQAALGGIASRWARSGIRIFHRHHLRIEGTHRLYSSLATRTSHLTMAVSQAVADEALREGTRPSTVRVAYNGVPEPRSVSSGEAPAIKRSLGTPDNHALVLMLGLLRPEKGQASLLKAVPHLLDQCSNFTIAIVGSEPERVRNPRAPLGEYALELRSLAAQVGGSVRFVDHQTDTAPWFAAADVVVVPSHTEAFGLVAAEAMATGRPVVCTGVGGLPEIVTDDETGLVVPNLDPQGLAAAIFRLLSQPRLRADYGKAGRARYRAHFTLNAMVRRWIEVYAESVRSSKTRFS